MDRRTLLAGLATGSAAIAVGGPSNARPPSTALKPYRRIAAEEGYSISELVDAVDRYMAGHADREAGLAALIGKGRYPRWPKLFDPEVRLRDMDCSGVSTQILVLNSPGVQIFEADEAVDLARLANDRAASWMRRWPDRFAPLAAFAPQDPSRAAKEIERAVHTLGLKGSIINSHTRGEYLDERKFWPILEAIEASGRPLYIHPREPSNAMIQPYVSRNLQGALWGYAAETSLHALRLIVAGVFDQFPGLKVVLGHLGEGIPFYLDRIDNRYRTMHGGGTGPLKRLPSEYFRDNFVITSSGANWAPAVRFCQQVLGAERVLFAVDYPFEDEVATVRQADAIPMSDAEFRQFYHLNAERTFGLAAS